MLYNALINLARTIVGGIIYTSPDMDILKELRKKSWLVCEVQVVSNSKSLERQVKIYKKRISASGQIYVSKIGYDKYRLDTIPDYVRKEYAVKRKKAMLPLINELSKTINEMKDTPPTHHV